jgi:hypothetical protein
LDAGVLLLILLLAGPSPSSEAVTNNACKSTRQAYAMVQQIMIKLYPVRSMGDQSLCYVGPGGCFINPF